MLLSGYAVSTEPVSRLWTSEVMVKSPNDNRAYRHLLLDNGMRVVLISDPEADKSAASLAVFRGSYHDPEDRPGLAHFLEHMLFIGTDKYPEPNAYFKFVQGHGGSSNAYTAAAHTNYFFDIQPEFFHEGLDRFAQFFISPLFEKVYVEREKNAVHSEYQLQLKEDNWRKFVVQKTAINPEHPAARFNIGSLETLAGDVHRALVRFFKAHYSANQMGLVVLTNEPLDEMQPWVSRMFSQVKNRNLPELLPTAPLFKTGQLPATLRFQSLRQQNVVSYDFQIPSPKEHYRVKPTAYFTNLLGHEGEGSLHHSLTGRGWITALSAGVDPQESENALVNITIELTDDGVNHIPEITAALFGYLDLLRDSLVVDDATQENPSAEPAAGWRYDEQAKIAALGFRFREQAEAVSRVRGISPLLPYVPTRDLLAAPYLMEQFDAALIQSFLRLLRVDNVFITISGPNVQGDSTEHWFKVPYTLDRGPVKVAAEATTDLRLPPPNPFVPESLDLLKGDDALPELIIKKQVAGTSAVEIYLDTDVEFRVPRAVMDISIRNRGGLIRLEDAIRARLYARLVEDDLNALAYPALLAGVGYEVAAPPRGFRVSLDGYEDKQLVLLDEVLTRLVNLQPTPERFAVIKAELLRDLANERKNKPFRQAYARLTVALMNNSWTPEQRIAGLEPVTLADLLAWRDRTLATTSIQAMLHGNVGEKAARDLLQLLERHLSPGAVVATDPEVREVSGIIERDIHVDHDDAAMVLYVQDDGDSFAHRATSALFIHLVRPGYFASLRTDQQLGYAVFATNTVLRDRGGVTFVIQSPVVGPDELRARTLAFLDSQVSRLATMTTEEFSENKSGLIARITETDKNMAQRAGRHWTDLDRGITTFNSNIQLADAVDRLGKADMQAFLKRVRSKLMDDYVMIKSQGQFADAQTQ